MTAASFALSKVILNRCADQLKPSPIHSGCSRTAVSGECTVNLHGGDGFLKRYSMICFACLYLLTCCTSHLYFRRSWNHFLMEAVARSYLSSSCSWRTWSSKFNSSLAASDSSSSVFRPSTSSSRACVRYSGNAAQHQDST